MRNQGIAFNTTIVMAAAKGIVKRCQLLINGGSGGIEITKWWVQSLLNRMGMVKHKACSKSKINPKVLRSSFYWTLNRLLT